MGDQCSKEPEAMDTFTYTKTKERRDSCHSLSDDSVHLQNLFNIRADAEGETTAAGAAADGNVGQGSEPEPVLEPVSGSGAVPLDKNKRGSHFSRKAVKMSKKVDGTTLSLPGMPRTVPEVPDSPKRPNVSKDLMISYSHADRDMMLRVRDKLERNGVSVWVDVSGLKAGVDFLSKIGEAIIDAKLFISLLSSGCVHSRYCQDELALAYISGSAIYPLAIEDLANFSNKMTHGMKLQLAAYEWTVVDEGTFDAKLDDLILKMKAELQRRAALAGKTTEAAAEGKPEVAKRTSRAQLNRTREGEISRRADGDRAAVMPDSFWKENFSSADSVDFQRWEEAFFATFREEIGEYFHSEEHRDWLRGILRRELEVKEDGVLHRRSFDEFCTLDEDGTAPVWDCVLAQATESQAIKEVFNMDSSVRVEAVENLGKFRSAAVIAALCDLLTDPDANVRAVASVSLARTETKDALTLEYLSRALSDRDRLVREAGCLALGHLRARPAVGKLLHLWRNDVISHVREAAQVALQQIGGPEVEKAMHVTKVLAEEIRQLTKQ